MTEEKWFMDKYGTDVKIKTNKEEEMSEKLNDMKVEKTSMVQDHSDAYLYNAKFGNNDFNTDYANAIADGPWFGDATDPKVSYASVIEYPEVLSAEAIEKGSE